MAGEMNNLSTKTITESPTIVKPAAIWARVSTQSQAETSLPSQISRCKEKLEQEGYSVTQTLAVDWTSLDLFSCPKFQELRSLIRNRGIDALAIFDRDRLEAKGLQRLVFLSECKESGVKLVIYQGPPTLDEPEGQLIELALAIGKERQVLRARQGSKDGLHDRATKRGLPTTYHKLFGYQWDKENKRLVPDHNWPKVKLIFDMLLDGASYHPIIQTLKRRGILSPSGQGEWNKAALSSFTHNPAYAGRYYALKKVSVEPNKRKTNSYGNSSVRMLPLNEAHYMPEIKVVDPPISWEQRQRILEQLAVHQKLAQRNAKQDYLLRGLIFCESHRGKRGEPRKYHGQPHYDSWRYVCPVGGCTLPYLPGPYIEKMATFYVKLILAMQPNEFYKLISNTPNRNELKKSLHNELSALRAKYSKNIDAETELEERFLNGKVLPEVHQRLKTKLQTEREWIQKQEGIKLNELAQLGHEDQAVMSLEHIQRKLVHRLDKLTKEEWKGVFATLHFELHIRAKAFDPEEWEEWPVNPKLILDKRRLIECRFGIPLQPVEIGEVVSIKAESALRNSPVYPLRLSLPNLTTELAPILAQGQSEATK